MLYIYIWEVQEHVSQVCSVRNKCPAGWIEEEQTVWQRTWLVCGKWFVTALEGIGEEGGKDQDRQPWLLRDLESSYQHDVAPEAGEAVFPQTSSIAESFSETETNPAARVQITGGG